MTEGTYLLDRIRHRCREDGDCLLWTGHKSESGVPRMASKSLRRLVYEDRNGPLKDRMNVSVTCEHSLCLVHLKANTKGAILKRVYATTDLRQRRSVTRTALARKTAKLDIEKVRAIRSSGDTIDVLAERYGVDRARISQVRRGVAWKDHANPFAGLGAR